ncbi:putative jacalin-like lectin domain-containing protein [Helianthus annuus]|nr:putative jacalin-like lectin domain-containing protein [Helianthus annuus]KAJ0552301.1 putative jacalin-like lectin domain-containing protein [Helianthus annuus]KAJ0718000.1 putative jacalin-like lectin domain-containing protein [Helianthus annuus]KAJ0721240.1 putative jacalin-like lectin domain-containing protein [Helianthus annuus]
MFIYPSLQKKIALIGPWGSSDGQHWSFKAEGKITKIIINHGEVIDAIGFASQDDEGNVLHSPKYGGYGGDYTEVNIDIDVEELNCMSGTIGWFDSKLVVTSLSFSTDVNKFGPFGVENGTHFSVPISKARFAGFFGRSSDYLDAIGVYLNPT